MPSWPPLEEGDPVARICRGLWLMPRKQVGSAQSRKEKQWQPWLCPASLEGPQWIPEAGPALGSRHRVPTRLCGRTVPQSTHLSIPPCSRQSNKPCGGRPGPVPARRLQSLHPSLVVPRKDEGMRHSSQLTASGGNPQLLRNPTLSLRLKLAQQKAGPKERERERHGVLKTPFES